MFKDKVMNSNKDIDVVINHISNLLLEAFENLADEIVENLIANEIEGSPKEAILNDELANKMDDILARHYRAIIDEVKQALVEPQTS